MDKQCFSWFKLEFQFHVGYIEMICIFQVEESGVIVVGKFESCFSLQPNYLSLKLSHVSTQSSEICFGIIAQARTSSILVLVVGCSDSSIGPCSVRYSRRIEAQFEGCKEDFVVCWDLEVRVTT